MGVDTNWTEEDERMMLDTIDKWCREEVRDKVMELENINVTSPVMEVVGNGSVTLDGYLDIQLEFPDLFAKAADWLILPRVVSLFASQVVRFQVSGFLRAPKAEPRWLFQGDAQRSRLRPIPAFVPPLPVKKF